MHNNYKGESIFYIEITLPLNELFVFQREYERYKGVGISLKPISKRPDAKGVELLAKFILLKYEFSYKFKYKANLTEIFTTTREKFYRLNDMQEIFEQKANKLYPYYKAFVYDLHNPLNDQLYHELDLLKNECSHYTECSEVLIRIRVVSG